MGQLAGGETVRVALVAEQFALPQGVVRVLHRQRLPLGGAPLASCRVGLPEVTQQHAHRPAVGRDVVHDQGEEVLVRSDPAQPRPQRCLRREIELVRGELARDHSGFGSGSGSGFGLVPGARGGRCHVRQELAHVVGVEDHLAGLALVPPDHGPQALVPLDQVPQRRRQSRPVQDPGQAQGERDVVRGRAALKLPGEPQAPLRER